MSTYKLCLMAAPSLKDIKGMDTFLDSSDDIKFEQYDLDNNPNFVSIML